jgi:hypothetical protein
LAAPVKKTACNEAGGGRGFRGRAASNGSSLGLLRLPFAFSQDQLLTSEAFIEARSYEIELTHDLL